MGGSASTCAPASSRTRSVQAPSSSGGMRDERAADDSDLRAAAMAQERVDANLFAVAHSQRQQAMASSALSTGTAATASFEQRLKDAASKKRLAREQRQHQHHKHRKHHQLHQTVDRADSLTTTAAAGADDELVVVASLDAASRVICERTIKPKVTDQSSPSSRSILETVKCCSHPLFSRWLLARTTSDPSASGTREEVDRHRQQVARNVNANSSSNCGWTSGTRQTTSEAVASASAAAEARARRLAVVAGESLSAPTPPPQRHRATRDKKNQSASFRLNRLLAKSLADTAMLPVRPASMRAAAHPTRTTRSVYAKPTAAGARPTREGGDARRSSLDISAMATVGNYARNIVGQDDLGGFRSNVAKPRELVKTIEEEETELEYAANVDGGYAWVILIVVFVINASTWGTARAYGQIFEKLARESGMARTQAAMPFTIMGAVENMAGPLSGCLLALTKSWRVIVVAGSTLITLAHLFAGLAANSQLGQLLSMGLMCGLGLSFVSISFFQVNNAYFVRYRNTAFGVGLAGAVFGTLLISPLCQYFLDNYEGTRACYLMLSLIISPNIALALLLKPKRQLETFGGRNDSLSSSTSSSSVSITDDDSEQVASISKRIEERARRRRSSQRRDSTDMGIGTSIRLVVANPLFHLIWPTQLIFCWFNFVFGMIIVDFGKDRGLNAQDVAHLVPAWAFGQLVGRLLLSSLVDLKILTYKSFTIICFLAIGVTMHMLNHTRLEGAYDELVVATAAGDSATNRQHYLTILILVFVLSMFIALLYILLNGLVFNYVETALQPLSLGISSFTGSFFLLPRANIIGYYRDTTGNYDEMLTMFTYVSMCAALVWLILPPLCKYLKDLSQRIKQSREMAHESIQSTRPYSAWQLDQQQHSGKPITTTNDHQV